MFVSSIGEHFQVYSERSQSEDYSFIDPAILPNIGRSEHCRCWLQLYTNGGRLFIGLLKRNDQLEDWGRNVFKENSEGSFEGN